MGTEKKALDNKSLLLSIIGLVSYLAITIITVYIYGKANLTVWANRGIQNGVYLILFLTTLGLCKLSEDTFHDYGIRFSKMPRQLIVGVGIGAGLLLIGFVFGAVPSIQDSFLYVVLSQLLVGASEELFWRGFLLQNILKISGSTNVAVGVSSLLFALSHMPNHLSLGYFIFTFVTGCILAVLRTEFKDSVGIPALAFGHALSNIF